MNCIIAGRILNIHIYKLEIVWQLHQFEHYLQGEPYEI